MYSYNHKIDIHLIDPLRRGEYPFSVRDLGKLGSRTPEKRSMIKITPNRTWEKAGTERSP